MFEGNVVIPTNGLICTGRDSQCYSTVNTCTLSAPVPHSPMKVTVRISQTRRRRKRPEIGRRKKPETGRRKKPELWDADRGLLHVAPAK